MSLCMSACGVSLAVLVCTYLCVYGFFMVYESVFVCVCEGSQGVTSTAHLQRIYGVMEILQMR